MIDDFIDSLVLYIACIIILILSLYGLFGLTQRKNINASWQEVYRQPSTLSGMYPWDVRSVDTQVISKHWSKIGQESVTQQVAMLKKLGVNYIAIGTPYDRTNDMYLWANEIHAQGLNVWYRSHWDSWEGDDGYPSTMTPEEYLKKTKQFIIDNPKLFVDGDAFTASVEAEQVGVGLGKRFLNWDEYRRFLISEITISSEAFSQIGMEGRIHTNWLSVNGWIVDNVFDQELVNKLGLIVVDHFVGQSQTIGEVEDPDIIVNETVSDLDRFHTKWNVPIMLGEWGYQIFQDVPEDQQAWIIDKLFQMLKTRSYLVGVNYWVHMGNSAAIISDEMGSNLKYKKGADVIRSYYDPTSEPLGI